MVLDRVVIIRKWKQSKNKYITRYLIYLWLLWLCFFSKLWETFWPCLFCLWIFLVCIFILKEGKNEHWNIWKRWQKISDLGSKSSMKKKCKKKLSFIVVLYGFVFFFFFCSFMCWIRDIGYGEVATTPQCWCVIMVIAKWTNIKIERVYGVID